MSEPLAGQTITITTSKNLNVNEIKEVVQSVFKATACPGCTSGGHFVLRHELELPVEAALKVRAVIT